MSESKPLAGRVALVTGSSTGIGRAIAKKLAQQGASLILHGRTDSAAAERIRIADPGVGGDVASLTADFADTNQLEAFLVQAWDLNNRDRHPGQQRRCRCVDR